MARFSIFVTGTDTEVGKTALSVAMLQWARQRGWQTLALKPIAAGCEQRDGRWYNDDAEQLRAAATVQLPYEQVNPVALPDAIAPHIAARHHGVALAAKDLAAHCAPLLQRDVDLALVEGAGGWLVPLNDTETFADIAVQLNLPVVMVVAIRLGCLNHALLTAAAIERAGLPLAGWIANCLAGADDVVMANVVTLQKRLSAPCLGVVPHCETQSQLAAAGRYLQLDDLFW